MRVLFDTNVVLDLLLDRQPWSAAAADLFARAARSEIEAYLAATSVTTVHSLASKAVGAGPARRHCEELLLLCGIAPVTRSVLQNALDSGLADFEDAVIEAAARQVGVDALVTRDAGGFAGCPHAILSPAECCEILRQLGLA